MRSPGAFFAFFAVSSFPLFACSTQDAGGRDRPTPPTAGLATPPPDRGIQLGFAVNVEPGREVVVCKELVIPGNAAIAVEALEHAASPGIHHIHAYRTTTPADKVSPDVFDCGDATGPLFYAAEKEAESTRFRPGVGITFARDEVVRIELHYLNTQTSPREASLRLNLWFARHPITAEAGSFFMFHHALEIPAHGEATARMHCVIPSDIAITSLLPHVHTHGTGERITLSGEGVDLPRLILDTRGYGDLEIRSFDDAPIVVKAGQALDFECDFKNGTDKPLVEGSSPTTAEMCAVLGSYYPRLPREAEWCTLPGSGPQQ